MQPRNILIIQGHPDPGPPRLCHALAAAYADADRWLAKLRSLGAQGV